MALKSIEATLDRSNKKTLVIGIKDLLQEEHKQIYNEIQLMMESQKALGILKDMLDCNRKSGRQLEMIVIVKWLDLLEKHLGH